MSTIMEYLEDESSRILVMWGINPWLNAVLQFFYKILFFWLWGDTEGF